MTKRKVGDSVAWTSQSSGTWRDKKGDIVAIVAGGASLRAALLAVDSLAPKSALKAQDVAHNERYLVRVRRPQRRNGPVPECDYYAPLVKVIDGRMA